MFIYRERQVYVISSLRLPPNNFWANLELKNLLWWVATYTNGSKLTFIRIFIFYCKLCKYYERVTLVSLYTCYYNTARYKLYRHIKIQFTASLCLKIALKLQNLRHFLSSKLNAKYFTAKRTYTKPAEWFKNQAPAKKKTPPDPCISCYQSYHHQNLISIFWASQGKRPVQNHCIDHESKNRSYTYFLLLQCAIFC